MPKRYRLLAIVFAVALLIALITGVLAYRHSANKDVPLVYSNKDMLQELWTAYKHDYLEQGTGRTLDKQQNNITTSEGESYTMLRAVWMDDQPTFDKSWQWTKDNLQRDDHLMSWKFGKQADGTYGVLTSLGGQNTASDADSDIALSLLMAYGRWRQDKYLYDAKPIIDSIWQKEVITVSGKPLLAADDLERQSPEAIINPSYFSPYAYKVFAKVDNNPAHHWQKLADASYDWIKTISSNKLNTVSSANIPPNWVSINRQSGALSATPNDSQTTDYGFDAFRTPWRLALDWEWNKDPRAKHTLETFGFLGKTWREQDRLLAVYKHDGEPASDYDTPAAYGADLGYFSVVYPDQAKRLYRHKLLPLYSPDKQSWQHQLSYYDDNWAWFGMALYLHALPNLTTLP